MSDTLAVYAETTPTKPAVIDDRPGQPTVTYTFAQLDARANQVAHLLSGLGAGPGTKVVWCGQNSAGLLVAVHGIRRSGAVGVPLNYRLTPEEAAYVVDNSDAEIVWVDAEYRALIDAIRAQTPKVREVLVFDGDGALEARLDALPVTAAPVVAPGAGEADDGEVGATMIYTSGTTGRPKGAVRPGAANPEQVGGLVALIGYTPDDVYLTTGPLYHSGPGGFAMIAHALGNTIVVQHKFDPEDWLRLVETYKVTTSFTAPTPIRMICHLPAEVKDRYDRSTIRRMIANAAPWTLALKKLYMADFPPDSLWEVYGSTELGVDTVLGPEDHLRKPGSCGKPAPAVEVKLFDPNGVEVTEPHVTGELYVRAASMFSTYYKAEEKYEADRRGDFHTVGDIAYFDEDGYFYIADRKNDMIISGGMNIYPAEIEAAIDQSDDVYEVAVFGLPDEDWGERVHAVVVPARDGVTAADVEAFAREHLASYKVPRSVSFADALPKTGSGKVLKRELKVALAPPAPDAADPT
ncbi:AMP-binding protein [Acidiferrimicrobium sp. IK]|uniref:class I adenylate-forming enzyme family protein n=1 Tax=Acidiferrimicrobium sp. IK TaxID=2871700 RepID=UPI0021CB01F9|nr:AMP-binding protein [Acidiferrimicrobium sp. IK]MCU4182851.1 AMP-binding protein [Acidiferrimicrobium sp. IK]